MSSNVEDLRKGDRRGVEEHSWRRYGHGAVHRDLSSRDKRRCVHSVTNCDVSGIGGNLATFHGQKFTILAIIDEEEISTCLYNKTGFKFKPHVIMA